jgi:hypothetical protein
MDKSSIVAIWTNSEVWVPHPWISTCPLSKGKSSNVHASPTGVQRHRPSDVVEATSVRVSRLVTNV